MSIGMMMQILLGAFKIFAYFSQKKDENQKKLVAAVAAMDRIAIENSNFRKHYREILKEQQSQIDKLDELGKHS